MKLIVAVMNDFLRHMGGLGAWLSELTCRFVQPEVFSRKFILIPQNVAFLVDRKLVSS